MRQWDVEIVCEYTVELQVYHDEIVGRLQFDRNGTTEESALYSLSELQNVVALWRDGALQGSFAIGTRLDELPVCHMTQKA